MSFSADTLDDIVVIKVKDPRATVEIADDFREELLKHINKGRSNVVVDLTKVEFLDSSFLGALVTGLKRSTMNGGDVKIVGLQPAVRSMFELTRLYKIFDIYETTKDALDTFELWEKTD